LHPVTGRVMQRAIAGNIDYGDLITLAQAFGRNCGYPVFPVGPDKKPALKKWPELASTDADAIARLYRDHPGPLVGIVCGQRSGISVLDLDLKALAASAWWHAHRGQIPLTRIYRTRSGGAHLYFRHTAGVRNSAGKIAEGVDVRGEGGFVISWWCVGLPCISHERPVPWPTWLLREILPRPAKPRERRKHHASRNTDSAIIGILRAVAGAAEGQRNSTLNWAAYHIGRRVQAGELGRSEAEAMLTEAAIAAGLIKIEAAATIASGLKGASA
jgi:Bifunctional DNA primase/polymerase, N-terminal